MTCEDRSPSPGGQPWDTPGLLATLTMKGTSSGTVVFSVDQPSSGNVGPYFGANTYFTCGLPVTCPGGSVTQDTPLLATETPTPTWTPAAATLTPTATSCSIACPTIEPTSTPDSVGSPYLAIDADPTNGTRPCLPIDAIRTDGPTAGTYQVSVCLVNYGGTPDALQLTVYWSGGVAAAVEIPGCCRRMPSNDNPDFNNAPPPYGFGTAWSCPSLGPYLPERRQPNADSARRRPSAVITGYVSPLHPQRLSRVPAFLRLSRCRRRGPGPRSSRLPSMVQVVEFAWQ